MLASFLRPGLLRAGLGRHLSVVCGFKDVSFGYTPQSQILTDCNFSVRQGAKVTIMGQNGAGKSSIIKLIAGDLFCDEGSVNVTSGERVSVAKQTMPAACRSMSVVDFFSSQFKTAGDHPGPKLMGRIHSVLKEVDLPEPSLDRLISSFSGGQQARLLLAAALITEPSVLLLDEPTNNLDAAGIEHLTELIEETNRTVLVISHDEDFLNSFTDSVLYLDMFKREVESFDGDYFFVKREIEKKRKKENSTNARLAKEAQAKKDQAGVFANKGGGMRLVAKKMREAAAEMESKLVDVRRDDVALRPFEFPFGKPRSSSGPLVAITTLSTRCAATGGVLETPLEHAVFLHKGSRLHVHGPNGIGKTTFLERIAANNAQGVTIADGASVGYYRQDFHNFDMTSTVLSCLQAASGKGQEEQRLRQLAAGFLLKNRVVYQTVGSLSEGQKALLSLACLVLEQPTVLIMDEPTNHVNFRHLPAIAKALKSFQGALIMVSHDEHMVSDVGCDQTLDLGFALTNPRTR